MGRLDDKIGELKLRHLDPWDEAFDEHGFIKDYTELILNELFKEIEHGDDEHRKWLKDKIEEFKKEL
jgi:hypothetical protein